MRMIEYKEKLVPLENHTLFIKHDHGYREDLDTPELYQGNHSVVVILLVAGCVFLLAFFSAFVVIAYKYHARKSAEYQRAARIHVTSTRNAGVYMDLAMDSPISKSGLPIGAPIYNSMKKRPDQYTFISDDELDL